MITYDIELPPSGKKTGFNLLDDEYFTIPYITDTIPNFPAGHQLPSQAKRNVWIVAINGEEPITAQGVVDELNRHQTPRGKSKIKISLCRRKSYQRADLEEICSIFDQVRPVVSNIEVCLPNKPLTPKNIGDALGGPQRQFWKEALFVQYEKNKNISLLSAPIPIKYLPEVTKVLRSLIYPSIREGYCSYAWKFVARHCVNGIFQIKVIYFDK